MGLYTSFRSLLTAKKYRMPRKADHRSENSPWDHRLHHCDLHIVEQAVTAKSDAHKRDERGSRVQ